MAVLWADEQRQIHAECGTARWEWDENPTAFHAEVWRCHGCREKDALRRKVSGEKRAKEDALDGIRIGLMRGPREEVD